MTNKPNNPFQEYSNCCGSLMDNDQTMCPECLEPCEKETRDERGMTWQTEFDEKLSRYIKNINVGQYDDAGVIIGFEKAKNIIKAFIQDLLDRKAEEIENTGIGFSHYGISDVDHSEYFKGYNEAKKQALSILKEE